MSAVVVVKSAIFLSLATFVVARQFPDFAEASNHAQLVSDTWQHLETRWHDRQWLESVMRNDSLHQSLKSAISPQCFADLTTWINSLQNGEMWAIQCE